jgi:hypothetical protein
MQRSRRVRPSRPRRALARFRSPRAGARYRERCLGLDGFEALAICTRYSFVGQRTTVGASSEDPPPHASRRLCPACAFDLGRRLITRTLSEHGRGADCADRLIGSPTEGRSTRCLRP